MDQREDQLQSISICNRLYNFIMKSLATHAFKRVILGRPLHQDLVKAQNGTAYESDEMMHQQHRRAQAEALCKSVEQDNNMKNSDPSAILSSSNNNDKQDGKELPTVQDNKARINNEEKSDMHVSPGKRPEEEAQLSSVAPQAKPPKKVVSINERVEEIGTSKNKMKRKKSSDKLTSLQCQEDEPKPLKSILKVGSDLGEKSSSFVNRSSDG